MSTGRLTLLGLGSNLGDRRLTIERAIEALRSTPGITELRTSSWHETEPVGGPPQGPFLNGAASCRTTLEPEALLSRCLAIETELGRERRIRWGPRTIDIDLLWVDGCPRTGPGLVLPHPRLAGRRFVLLPLLEVLPDWRHPQTGASIPEMLAALEARTA